MVMAGLDLQFNVGKGHYISLLSDFANNMLGARETPMGFNNGYMIAGAGLQYGMDFVLGSVLRADLHWSTLDGFGAYIALGMDF